jgi:hypothetical protein
MATSRKRTLEEQLVVNAKNYSFTPTGEHTSRHSLYYFSNRTFGRGKNTPICLKG